MPANFTFCLILQIVSPDEVTKTGLAYLHTAHCLGSGEIMISAMGTPDGKEQGIVVLDLFNNKDGQSHNSKKIMNAEKQKVPRRVSPFLAWGDFHARSRFVRFIIPKEKWGTTRSLSTSTP